MGHSMKKIKLYSKFNSTRVKPVNFKNEHYNLFENEFNKSFPETYLLFAKNVSLNFLELSKYSRILSFSKHTKMKKFKFYKKLKYFFDKPDLFGNGQIIDKGTWILDEKSFHYFHWMCDAIPRLIQIISYTDEYPVLIPDKFFEYSFVVDSLKELDVNYKIYSATEYFTVKNLLISSHVAPSGNYKKEIMIKIRELIAKKSSQPNSNKIWISREKSKHRKIVNENELRKILAEYDYKIIYPEDFSFTEQSKIFSKAKVVAGLHGGGLTNIIYLNEGSILFEIRREEDFQNNCYFTLASDLDLKYYYLNSQKLGDDLYVDNVTVNVKEFEKILQQIEHEIN